MPHLVPCHPTLRSRQTATQTLQPPELYNPKTLQPRDYPAQKWTHCSSTQICDNRSSDMVSQCDTTFHCDIDKPRQINPARPCGFWSKIRWWTYLPQVQKYSFCNHAIQVSYDIGDLLYWSYLVKQMFVLVHMGKALDFQRNKMIK